VEEVLADAQRFGDEGDWQEMAVRLREGLERHPGDPFLLCWLGVAERELGMEGIAYERFRASLAANPRDAYVLATAGNAVAAFDDPAAEPALRTAAMLAPDLALARWMYGAWLSREGFGAEALTELQAARALDPDEAGISYELGVALALSGNEDGAVDELYRAAELDPADGWTRVVLGLALVGQERLDDALPELTVGAEERPDDIEAQLLTALAAAAEDDESLAWEMLERARLAGAGQEVALLDVVEERLTEGAEGARAFLVAEMAPSAYRERLGERP
jgi:Flp pilus assembly protein TadD